MPHPAGATHARPVPHRWTTAAAAPRRALTVLCGLLAAAALLLPAMPAGAQETAVVRAEPAQDPELTIVPLGADADGDGIADLLYLVREPQPDEPARSDDGSAAEQPTRVTLRSGADRHILWDQDIEGGAFPLPDVDGDSVPDLATGLDGGGEGSWSGVDAIVLRQGVSDYSFSYGMDVRSGRDGAHLAALSAAVSESGEGVAASLPVLPVGVSMGTWSWDVAGDVLLGVDQAVRIEVSASSSDADVPFARATLQEEASATYTFLALDGTVRGVVERDGMQSFPVAAGDLDADGILDLLTMERPAASGPRVHLPIDEQEPATLVAWGSTGAQLWSRPAPPNLADLRAVGDLDGDGSTDMGLLEFHVSGGPFGGTFSAEARLLSGRDGSDLASRPGFHVILPFDDRPAGEPDVALLVSMELEGGLEYSAVGADLEPRWSEGHDAWPVELGFEAARDWTGDGWADLLLAADAEPEDDRRDPSDDRPDREDDTKLALLDGRTGATAWSRTVEAMDGLAIAPAGGADGPALVATSTTGRVEVEDGPDDLRNATTLVRVLDGADGRVLYTFTARSPGTTPYAPGRAWAHAMPAGDLTGDGVDDLLVQVSEGGTEVEDGPDEPMVTVYYAVSSATGQVLFTEANAVRAARSVPDATPEAGFVGDPAHELAAPAPGLALGLVLLGAGALRRRACTAKP